MTAGFLPTATTLKDAAAEFLAGAEQGAIPTRSGGRYKPATLRSYRRALDARILPVLGSQRLTELQRRGRRRGSPTTCRPVAVLDELRAKHRRLLGAWGQARGRHAALETEHANEDATLRRELRAAIQEGRAADEAVVAVTPALQRSVVVEIARELERDALLAVCDFAASAFAAMSCRVGELEELFSLAGTQEGRADAAVAWDLVRRMSPGSPAFMHNLDAEIAEVRGSAPRRAAAA